jgi:hypothetical protein
MSDQGTGRMRPLYEAMSVCSYTIEWLEQGERNASYSELQSNLARLSQAIGEFVELARRNPLASASAASIDGYGFCVETLNSMTQLLSGRARERLSDIPAWLQQPISLLLGQIDKLSEQVEDILEAWQLVVNEDLASVIDSAVDQIDKSKTEVADWRSELELIQD